MTIADRIKDRRIDLDMSQTELALKAGYSNKAAISKLEHAGDDISMKQVRRVAKALGVSPAFLMGWETDEEEPDVNDERLRRLILAYSKASPELQRAVEAILKSSQPDP